MLETILSIIVKYWVELLLGGIVLGGKYFVTRYINLDKKEKQQTQDEYYTRLFEDIQKDNKLLVEECTKENQRINQKLNDQYEAIITKVNELIQNEHKESKHSDESLQEQINKTNENLNLLQSGILEIQGKMFKQDCRELLKDDHVITLEEWEELDKAHEVYNALGGNHTGDYLFSLVSKKAEHILTKSKEENL